ncbi:TetR/AcrR family transcriptional regulator [Lederbergia sp. NSJ-179]|uniref:TetR/AcrR family transcriptional regulator n=1 Tax=Lederbergia sp. NSJ-179 TaxID=2931402 RepID=UPI001FD2FD03|nr:TetR/AcrR family transcriptional regulator [Lederbergia sp. NSJ-179]MCJ7842520.1 TetR/AcrR family transcriptional regulator [Lederbergia sp. NSJ-179]
MLKKQLIMEKALELFAEQGFRATSVQQITDRCGISKGAFYLSFKSKDELILTLIDHFMMQITSDIDYLVKDSDDDKLLYEFYYTTYTFFHKHKDFAKLFMQEQMQTVNEELIVKMHQYNKLHEKAILSLVERVYGDRIKDTKYDLIFCIKSFMGMYAELFLYENVEIDFDLLSRSLVEKTNLLAKYMTIPFISQDYIPLIKYGKNQEVTKDQLLESMEQKMDEMEDSLEKESLLLLKQELITPSLSPAIVKGLIENIRNHPHCKGIAYLLEDYYEMKNEKRQDA